MRRMLLTVGFLAMAVSLVLWSAEACGDKLLVLGRGVRFQMDTADYPASILLYMNPDLPGSAAVGDTQLQTIMRQVGHRLRSVKTREEIASALKVGRYDIVLADFSDAPDLDEIVRTAPSQPVLLPWVYQDPKADSYLKARYQLALKSAKERYRAVLKAPASAGLFLSIIDRTMELKSKSKQARTDLSRSTLAK